MCGSVAKEQNEIEETRLLILHEMDSKLCNVKMAKEKEEKKTKRNPKMRKIPRFVFSVGPLGVKMSRIAEPFSRNSANFSSFH